VARAWGELSLTDTAATTWPLSPFRFHCPTWPIASKRRPWRPRVRIENCGDEHALQASAPPPNSMSRFGRPRGWPTPRPAGEEASQWKRSAAGGIAKLFQTNLTMPRRPPRPSCKSGCGWRRPAGRPCRSRASCWIPAAGLALELQAPTPPFDLAVIWTEPPAVPMLASSPGPAPTRRLKSVATVAWWCPPAACRGCKCR